MAREHVARGAQLGHERCVRLVHRRVDLDPARRELGRLVALRGATRRAASVLGFAAAALVVLLVARDLLASSDGHAPSGIARFMHLMTYRYDRRWPGSEALAPAIGVVAFVAAATCVALASRRWRGRATLAFGACAALSTTLLLDGLLVRASSDGGQRGVYEAYYRSRGTAGTPLVAYQLNWKGENFYTGNNVAIFIASGAPLRSYLDARRRSGESTVYFVTERGRVTGLRSELGAVRSFAEMTDRATSYEFSLVRAEL
jgi:hypothetical protein